MSFLYIKLIAKKEAKLTIISKFKSFKESKLNKFLKITKCPLELIGKGSVKP